ALMTLDGELEGMLRQTASPKAGWVWADAPGAEALTGERIRGELRRPQDMPPGVRPSGGWVQWDGQATVALPPVQP
ncbi:MAG: hypothetical protein VX000_09370, partial [Myxococcota bacterium]|nr:hypothetical protein [Myxococcota bacterium]